MLAVQFAAALLLAFGFLWTASALLLHDRTLSGRRGLRQMDKWQRQKRDLWNTEPLQRLTNLASRLVFLDPAAEERLERQLSRAGINATPEQFTARKFVILGGCEEKMSKNSSGLHSPLFMWKTEKKKSKRA